MKVTRNKTNILLLCLMALSAGFFTACDETIGSTNEGYAAGFPTDTLVMEVVPGDTVPISFNVGYNWRVTSDKDWCRVDGFKSISGKPGEHTVEFVIGEPENLFVADEALITMRMNDESRIIARIVCLASEKYMVEVSAGDKVYADGESIVIGTSGQLVLNLASNFNIEQLGYGFPTWVDMQLVDSVMTLNVKADSLKYIINNECDSLCLFKDSTFHRSFPVQYVGMDPRTVLVAGQLENPLVVSRDAKYASVGDEQKELPIEFTVSALNDEYQVLSLGYDNINGYSVLTDADRWFELTDDNYGEISFSVTNKNESKDRTAILLVFPQVIADSLANISIEGVVDFLYEEVDGVTTFKEDVKQYLLTQVTQNGSTNITISPETQWGLKVSVDGKTYTTSVNSGGDKEAPVKALITADDGYQLLHVGYDNAVGCVIIPEETSWLNVTDNGKDSIEVRFDRNTGNMRTAYLFAVPTVLAEDFEGLDAELFEKEQESGLKEIRVDAEKYVVAQFIQAADEESSMKVIDARFGWKYLTVEREVEKKWIDVATAKGVPANKIFRADLKSGASFLLNPLLDEEVWNPAKETIEVDTVVDTKGDSVIVEKVIYKAGIAVYGESGTQYTKDVHFEAEPTKMEEEEGDYMLVQFKAKYDIEEEYYIIYFFAEDKYLKALVVWNYWSEE